jgi:hypothetical protein
MWRKGTEKSRNMQILLIELEDVFEDVGADEGFDEGLDVTVEVVLEVVLEDVVSFFFSSSARFSVSFFQSSSTCLKVSVPLFIFSA